MSKEFDYDKDYENEYDEYDEEEDMLEDEDEDDEEDEDEEISLYDYSGYPYAMETVNGEIVSLSSEFQSEVRGKYLNQINLSEEELAEILIKCLKDYKYASDIIKYDASFLSEFLGYESDTKSFSSDGIGLLDSSHGYEANRFLRDLGYSLDDNINYGAHGHDTWGVYYIK